MSQSRKSKTPLIYALEQRLLFDGDLGADAASAIVYRDGNDEAPAVAPENQREVRAETQNTRTSIVFIDGSLDDRQTLIDAVPDGTELHIIDETQDGFQQIAEILQHRRNIDAVHIFGHGASAEAHLGTASLSLQSLNTQSDILAVLKNSLTEDGDILLYGCDIAAGEDGDAFIEELAELTAADIAASDDITGAGGDWELEASTGPIETETIIASDYLGRLSNGVTSTTNVTETHSATDLQTGSSHAGDGLGIQITQERTAIQTDAELNFNLGSNLTNDAGLQLDTYLVYRNNDSGNSGSARIVFDNGIAGINWVDWRSDDSGVLDAQFAKIGASYDDPQGRGLESSDQARVSFSGRVLNISGSGLADDADYMRVFVYSSPAAITAVDDTVTVTESDKVETSPYQAADNINLIDNDTTTSSSKRVVGLGSSLETINDNPSHDNIGSLGLSAIAGVYGELRVASNNTISYWVTDDAALEAAIASANGAVTETFYYRVANEFGSESEAQLTITINQANDRPVAGPYTITRDYDAAGFTIGTASSDHPLVAGNISDADSSSFTFSGIHENTNSNITLANAKQQITITDFGTITVNANDELVFTPDAALANLPQGQTISRSFIYFVSDDGGAYNANEAGTSVDRTDRITITINGQADIPVAQVSDVARFYLENNNSTTPGGRNLSTQTLNVVGNYDLSYSANPTQHGQSNLATGNIVSSLWTVEGEGNTVTFDSWVDADGNEVNGRAYSVSRSDSLPNGPYIDGANLYHINGQVSMFTQDGSLAEGQTGTYTWYYRVNVENSGNVVSSAIGQLDITLQGTNDDAESSYSSYTSAVNDTENGQRITTPVTQSVNIYDTVQDPDSGDTIRADRIRINVSSVDGTIANYASSNDYFYLNRGQSTDDANWDQAAAWGELANHFSFTFNEDGTIDWVSKREAYRSHGGYFTAYVTDYTEIRPGADDISHTNANLGITQFAYSQNSLEFIDDSVSVNSSAGGSGSVDTNDFLFTTLASFQRSTGNYNVREAAGETIVGEYITLTMNANGSYSYTVNQAAYDALADGETASESFTYWGDANTDAGNAIGEATLTFNITGLPDNFVAVNDTARVVAGATISGSAGDIGNQSSLSVYETSGRLTSNDINDVGNLTVVSFRTGREADGSGTDISLTGSSWTSVTNGQIRWYNNSYEFQASGSVTSEVTEYFTYTVENGDGEADTAELAITIVPTTDNEFVVADNLITMTDIGDEAELTKTNIGVTLISSGRISSGNKNGADYAVTGYAAGEGGSGFSNVGQTIRGTYGTLTITSDGIPTYVFDRPYSLNADERGYDVFTFEVTDGRDPATTNTAQFTVQINGQNTTPSWSSDAAIAIAEDTGVVLTKYGDVAAQGSYITRTSNGDGTYDYTYDAQAFNDLGDNERGYNTALTGGWSSYLIDEIGDVDSYKLTGNMASYGGQFDGEYVEYSGSNGVWTQWRMPSNSYFSDNKIGTATNRDTILIGSVPFGSNNTNDKITKDNAVPVGESQTFSVGSSRVTTTGSDYDDIVNIRGTFDVTVIGIQNTEVVSVADDSASDPALFRFGNFYQGEGGGQYPDNTLDLFSNDDGTSDYSNIDRIEISADGTSGWTAIARDNDGNAAPSVNSRILSGSDFYWRGGKYYSGESYIEFSPSNFDALPAGAAVTGEFYYRIVELDGTTSNAALVSASLTPVDDPAEVHRQGAVLDSSGTISVGASQQPNWNNNDGGGVANPADTGVSTRYLMGTGNNGDGISISEVDMPGEHTGGLLDKSNNTDPADPEDNSVILSVTPRYMSGATTSELQGLGNNSDTSVTLRGDHGELTVNENGSYTYNADTKQVLNWIWNNSYENYDYFDSFDIQIGPTGVGGAGSVTTTLDIFFDGTDTPPVAVPDTAHVREDQNISVSGNAAAITVGGDDDTAVDAPGEHSGNLLANDTDVNENANLYIASGGAHGGNTLDSGTDTDNPYRTDAGTYGTITIYRDGSYTYVADQQAADNLAAGETAEDIFYYRVWDNHGDTDQGTLTITVHGLGNEAYDREVTTPENQPYDFVHTIVNNEITATDFWTSSEVDSNYNPPIEITSLPHSGTLRLGETDIVLSNGRFRINAEDMGNLIYVPPENTHGDDYTFFTYEILVDGQDMSDVTVTMTIDITPDANNAAPTVTDPTSVTANISEIADGATGETTADVTASGSFAIADGDNDAVTVSETNAVSTHSGGSVLGALTINPITNNTDDDGAGEVTWSYAINDSHLDMMAVGDSFTETFTLTVDDGNGGTVTQDIIITVNGANDAPVARADYAAIGEGETLNVADAQGDDYTDPVTAGTSTGDVLHTAAAAHADTDVDGDTLRVSAIAPDGGSTATINAGGNAQVTGAHGVLTMYAHGGYDYTADSNVTEAGATVVDSFSYTVNDDNGGTTTATLQITITDVPNNPPTIEAQTSVTGSVTELDDPDATEDTASLTTSGSFTIADLDNDGVSVSVAEAGTTREGGGFLGALTATVDNDTDGDGSGEIGWAYTIANSDIGGFDVGQNFSETFTITVTDTNNGTVTQDVTVTVNGANDVPDIQNDSYTVSFGNTLSVDAANGLLANDSDDDDQDVLVVDAAAVSAVDFNTVASGTDMTGLVGTYGTLTIDTDGGFTYTPDANNAALQALDNTATVTETFYIDVHDGNATNIGAGGRNVNQLDIVIAGLNDAPVAVDDVISVTVGTPVAGNIIDPDTNTTGEAGEDSDADGDALTVSQYETNGGVAGTLGQALQGVYGTLLISADGSYTYTVDETNADVIAWGIGDPVLTETFNYTISDPANETASAVITVNISGVNDPPEADPIVETRTKLDAQFSVNLVTDANATDIDGDTLTPINDGDLSDDEPVITVSRTGTTRVMVTADSGLYLIDDAAVAAEGFALNPGRTYIFDWSEAPTHPLRFSETLDGRHGGGVAYETGVTVDAVAGTTTIIVSATTPTTLYVYCENHAAMGFGTPVEAYDVPADSYSLVGSTLTVDPQVFADLASDNQVEIAIAYKIADGDVTDDATYVIDNTATITITGLNTRPQIIDNYDDGINDNDAPNVADVTTPEDTPYVFTLDDFNYVDQDHDPMASVLITQGPLLGELTLNDVPITDSRHISRADIEAGLLKYTPPADENGNAYTAFSYAVNDGRADSDVGAMTIHVTPVNDPPSSGDKFVRIPGERTVQFTKSEFKFSDKDDADKLDHITLRSLPQNGVLYLVPDDVALPASVDPPMDDSWAISEIDVENGRDIPAARLARLVYVANEAVNVQNYDAFTFTVNDGSRITPGPLDSNRPNKIELGKVMFVEPFIEREVKKPQVKEVTPQREKPPTLSTIGLQSVLKVGGDGDQMVKNDTPSRPIRIPDADQFNDDGIDLGSDNWMNARASSQPDLTGNIRIIDLNVNGRDVEVQINDEATDKAETFKGVMADGKPLPSWVKVDRETGATTARLPEGSEALQVRVLAEDGSGNTRAIDLVLDPSSLADDKPPIQPANADSTPPPSETALGVSRAALPRASASQVDVTVSNDGQVNFDTVENADFDGSLKLTRMFNDIDIVKIEITDDAREDGTRYTVLQKDGSEAPAWVSVNAQTGELTIDAPDTVSSIELKIVAIDGSDRRSMDIEVDVEELREPAAEAEQIDDRPQDISTDNIDENPAQDGSISQFKPLHEQINLALHEGDYGRDLQQAINARS